MARNDGASRARIAVGGIGSVEVEPNTRLQLVANGREHHMALDRGTIHARIWAPPSCSSWPRRRPRRSISAAPTRCRWMRAATACCGSRTGGWVWNDGRATYIPEGACLDANGSRTRHAALRRCSVRVRRGADGPRLCASHGSPARRGPRPRALDCAPPGCADRWHLLTRGSREERERVYDRLAALAPPPNGVTRDLVLAGNRLALDRWWDWLGIETSTWWRLLKKKW